MKQFNDDRRLIQAYSVVGVTMNGKIIGGIPTKIPVKQTLHIPQDFEFNATKLNVDGDINCDGEINML